MAMPTRETAVTTIEELLALPDDGLLPALFARVLGAPA